MAIPSAASHRRLAATPTVDGIPAMPTFERAVVGRWRVIRRPGESFLGCGGESAV